MSETTSDKSRSSLTPEQREALDVRGVSVALSAGAGSGKTTVLTARYLGELEGPNPRSPGEIIALTFTDKAARELRQRVRDACRARATSGPDRAYWRSVLRSLDAAPIGTFHGFCGDILRRYAISAGVDPAFAVAEEAIAPTIRDEAIDGCLRRWLSDQEPDLIDLAVEFGLEFVRDALIRLVSGRGAETLEHWAGRSIEDLVSVWAEAWITDERPARIRRFVADAGPCLEMLRLHTPDHPKMQANRATLLAEISALETARDPIKVLLGIVENKEATLGGSRVKNWPTPEVYASIKDMLESLRGSMKKICESLNPSEEMTFEAARHGLRFARLASEARSEYADAKRKRGLVDFDDLLLMTRDVLRDHAETVRAELAAECGLILVDEFQDTDPLQAEILELLSGGDLLSGKFYFVGDFKQSIYRFRGARPDLFLGYRARFPEEGRKSLRANFRSDPAVLDFVNALFDETFPDDQPLVASRPADLDAEPAPRVEFLWANEPDSGAKRPGSRSVNRMVEARWIARRIAQAISDGTTIVERKTGQRRPVGAGDFALLFRTLNDATTYEAALAHEGLDYYVVGGKAYYAQQEIHDVINVLSVVEDPHDGVSLAGALRGPFFNLSDDALFWLVRDGNGSLVDGLDSCDGEGGGRLDPDDFAGARRARRLLREWRSAKDRVPIAAIVARVLDESGAEAAMVADTFGERQRANARKLIRMARRFDSAGGFTVADFVARLRADLRKAPAEEQAATTDEQGSAVRIMTIHKAKGLEFPFVFVPDLDRRSEHQSARVLLAPDLGPIVCPPGDALVDVDQGEAGESMADSSSTATSMGWLIHRGREDREDREEALRLFYVATTRARDRLVLSAARPLDAAPHSAALKLLAGRFDLTSGTFLGNLPPGVGQPVVRVINAEPAPPFEDRDPAPFRSRGGLNLNQIADAIFEVAVDDAPGNQTTVVPTPVVDLDPARGVDPESARLIRLVRSVMRETIPEDAEELAAKVEQAGRIQNPVAVRRLRANAFSILSEWQAQPFARPLARNLAIREDVAWSVMAGDQLILGRTDLVADLGDGGAMLVHLAAPGCDLSRHRLRALLALREAESLGLGVEAESWVVQLDLPMIVEQITDPSDLALARALLAFNSSEPVDS
ncbi:UvrD-helicase domain-containing protein [Isosphaeraceae bacterium EP7]